MILADPEQLLGEPPPLPADLESALRQMLARHQGERAELRVCIHMGGGELSCVFEEPGQVYERRGRFAWRLVVRT